MTTPSTRRYGHAVVLGGSMAGLATAQALSRHFQQVTIIERDELLDQPDIRAGVPQANHLHAMLTGGANALESLLPGFVDGLLAAGAEPIHLPTDVLWLNPAGWVTRFEPRHRLLSASRALIEWQVRHLVRKTAGITILDRRTVLDLCLSADRRRVTGVSLAPAADDGGTTSSVETLAADLVVDATGRRSRLPDWLEQLGFDRPAETRIDAHLSYSSRIYRRSSTDPGWKAAFIQAQPKETIRMGIMFPIEGDRWIVTLQGAGDDRPPTTDRGFDEFAATLRSPLIHEAIRDAEPLTTPVGWANTANLRRHYERLRHMPDRLLVVGDSACAFNPVYGQGMSVAAKTAVAIDEHLDRNGRYGPTLDGFTRRMQKVVARTGDAAWMMATADDLRFPATTGAAPSRVMRLQHRFLDRVLAAGTVDKDVFEAIMQAFLLLSPPTVLFRPGIITRSLRRGGSPNTTPPVVALPARPERAMA